MSYDNQIKFPTKTVQILQILKQDTQAEANPYSEIHRNTKHVKSNNASINSHK